RRSVLLQTDCSCNRPRVLGHDEAGEILFYAFDRQPARQKKLLDRRKVRVGRIADLHSQQQSGPQHWASGFVARTNAPMNLPSIWDSNSRASRPLPVRKAAASSALYTLVGSIEGFTKPVSRRRLKNSCSSSAPATQPAHH